MQLLIWDIDSLKLGLVAATLCAEKRGSFPPRTAARRKSPRAVEEADHLRLNLDTRVRRADAALTAGRIQRYLQFHVSVTVVALT